MRQDRCTILGLLAMVVFLGLNTPSYGTCPDWTVDKSADQTNLILSLGQQIIVNYQISIDVLNPNTCSPDEDNSLDTFDTYWVSEGNPKGYLGTIKYVDTEQYREGQVYSQLPKRYSYSRIVGPFYVCGDYRVDNVAKICNGKTDTWTISVRVPCVTGCTLTPGYWKTHSKYGPAPYDDNWALLGDADVDGVAEGEDETFYRSGKSWYEILGTSPAKGNEYFILAHQYIAAKLNILNGASSTPEADTAIVWAESFFNTYGPSSNNSKTIRNEAISVAHLLDQYNNGYIGPGHCSE